MAAIVFAAVPACIALAGWFVGGDENPATAFGWVLMYYASIVFSGLIFGICAIGSRR